MKQCIFFLAACGALGILGGCQGEREEMIDLDQMALIEEEFDDRHLAGEPLSSPQEVLLKEPPSSKE